MKKAVKVMSHNSGYLQIFLPKFVVAKLNLKAGDRLEIKLRGDKATLKKAEVKWGQNV